MWFFKQNGINFRNLMCALHNDAVDYTDAAQVILIKPEREEPYLLLGLPFIEGHVVVDLISCVCSGQVTEYIQTIRCPKIIHSQREWLTQISHKIKPLHYEKYKVELPFTKILNTGYRYGMYKDFLVICGRTLAEPLKDRGWKHEIRDVVIVGKNDWYVHCDLAQYPKYVDLVYQLHNNGQDITKIDQPYFFPTSNFWTQKDKFRSMVQNSRTQA
jgi:hypothetical protein